MQSIGRIHHRLFFSGVLFRFIRAGHTPLRPLPHDGSPHCRHHLCSPSSISRSPLPLLSALKRPSFRPAPPPVSLRMRGTNNARVLPTIDEGRRTPKRSLSLASLSMSRTSSDVNFGTSIGATAAKEAAAAEAIGATAFLKELSSGLRRADSVGGGGGRAAGKRWKVAAVVGVVVVAAAAVVGRARRG